MAHMECMHQLGLSCGHYTLLPTLVHRGLSGITEDVEKRTLGLDDSVTVDHTYRTFLVEMEKFKIPCQNNEQDEREKHCLLEGIVQGILHGVSCLKDLFDTKCKLCFTSGLYVPAVVFFFSLIDSPCVVSIYPLMSHGLIFTLQGSELDAEIVEILVKLKS
jgi:hypothetical protein